MDLTLESGRVIRNVSDHDLLTAIHGEQFAILEADAGAYIQCARTDSPGEFALEFQDDSLDEHFRAVDGPITLDRVIEAFIKYRRGDASWRTNFRWEKMEL